MMARATEEPVSLTLVSLDETASTCPCTSSQISASTDNCSIQNESDCAANDDDKAMVFTNSAKENRTSRNSAVIVMENNCGSRNFNDREAAMQRLSCLFIRRNLALIDLSQRCLTALDANIIRTALTHNPSLSVLKLGYNNLKDSGCEILAPAIRSHPSLSLFDVGFNAVSDGGCEAIAKALVGNMVLQKLYLSGNVFGERGCVALAAAIEHGCALTCLHLTANKVGSSGVLELMNAVALNQSKVQQAIFLQNNSTPLAGGKQTSGSNTSHKWNHKTDVNAGAVNKKQSGTDAVPELFTIQELFLGGTAMKAQGCLSVSNMLLTNVSLRTLSLSDNTLTDTDISLLSQSLSRNKTVPLEVIQLSFNQITCVGVEALMNAIWGSQTLREIRLDNNRIRDRGAQLAAVVLTSVPLKVLDMGFNLISTVGTKALMKSLATNSTLRSLTLSGNALDTNAAKAVSYALAFNKHLEEFFIDHCSVECAAQRHIAAGIVSNSRVVLKVLTGFPLGAATVTLGFPTALEQWSNEQVLKFIRLMWARCPSGSKLKSGEKKGKEVGKSAPVVEQSSSNDNAVASHQNNSLCDPATVVAVAKCVFESLGGVGKKALQLLDESKQGPSPQCPLVPDSATVLERSPCGTLRVPSLANLYVSHLCEQPNNSEASSVSSGSISPLEVCSAQVARGKRNRQWLSRHRDRLREVRMQPFSDKEMCNLYKYFFSPDSVPDESDCGARLERGGAESFSRSAAPPEPPGEFTNSLAPEGCAAIPSEQSSCNGRGSSTRRRLQRKLSYRYLNEAISKSCCHDRTGPERFYSALGRRRDVSEMSDSEVTCQTVQPVTKRARSSAKLRIDMFPRVKEQLEILKAKSLERQTLTMMKQLKLIENLLFEGRNIYKDENLPPETKDFDASDVEAILLDLSL